MNTSARLLAVIVGVGIGALATGSFTPAPAIAQTTSVALTRSLEAHMDRPLTPPEAWAVTAAAKSHTMDVRRIRERFAMRLAEATGLALDTVAPLIPPLGRGTQSAMPPDIAGSLADLLGRPLTPRESASVAAAEAERPIRTDVIPGDAGGDAPHVDGVTTGAYRVDTSKARIIESSFECILAKYLRKCMGTGTNLLHAPERTTAPG